MIERLRLWILPLTVLGLAAGMFALLRASRMTQPPRSPEYWSGATWVLSAPLLAPAVWYFGAPLFGWTLGGLGGALYMVAVLPLNGLLFATFTLPLVGSWLSALSARSFAGALIAALVTQATVQLAQLAVLSRLRFYTGNLSE